MKLFFRHFGQGNPLIILHGLFGISDNWVTIGKRLSEDFEVFIPDLRNHGQSLHSPVFTIPALVEDLLDFTEGNKLENVVLMGHSLGGLTSMQFALEYPHLVKKIIEIINIGINPALADPQYCKTADRGAQVIRNDAFEYLVGRDIPPDVPFKKYGDG